MTDAEAKAMEGPLVRIALRVLGDVVNHISEPARLNEALRNLLPELPADICQRAANEFSERLRAAVAPLTA